MNHILSIAESPDTHCAISGPSNLVFSLAAPDVEISLAQSPTSSNPQSRNQRRINVDRVSFDRDPNSRGDGWASNSTVRKGVRLPRLVSPRVAFRADSYNRCFRYRDCFDGGSQPFMCGSRGLMDRLTRARRATFKAVSLSSQFDRITQTRQDGSLNKYQPDSQLVAEICIGPTAVCKCSPRTGTYVDWGPEYTLLGIPNVERAGDMAEINRSIQ